jgi:alpha-L-fucosidase
MKTVISTILMATALIAQPQSGEAERLKRLEWWSNARFGMFIHWGLYAVPAGEWNGKPVNGIGEWIMNRAKIPVAEYEKLAGQFNPVKFDADAWVAVAKNAGMKYIVITAKHHDGFAMFKSEASKYNIVDATPFHRDPMKELAAACQRAGIKLCFYYSQTQDWHEADGNGNTWDFGDESKKDFAKYFHQKVIPQVRELLTNYGPVGLIWFDTPRIITKDQSEELAALVHKLQPQCLVNGRVGHGAGDYDSVGDNQISVGAVKRQWETPVTLNDTWGFKTSDDHWKPASILIRQLAEVASRGGNYLLNVGPTALGEIPAPSVQRLADVGRWMKANEESIRGSGPSPVAYEEPWGVMTTKPGKVYLHVFDWPKGEVALNGLNNKVTSVHILSSSMSSGAALKFSQTDGEMFHSLRIQVPENAPDLNDSVLALDVEGTPTADPSLLQQPDGVITLPAYMATLHKSAGSKIRLDSRGVVQDWLNASDSAEWKVKVDKPGNFSVAVITSQQKYGNGWDSGQAVHLESDGETAKGSIVDDGKETNPSNPYWPYVVSKLGQVKIGHAGSVTISLKADDIPSGQKWGLTVVAVRLIPGR